MKLKNVRSRFYFSLYQHNAQSLYADPVNDKNSCDPYCRCNSFRTEKKKNFQCRTSWNNEPRRIFHQHDQQPLRLGAKKTEGAQKDCRGEMSFLSTAFSSKSCYNNHNGGKPCPMKHSWNTSLCFQEKRLHDSLS